MSHGTNKRVATKEATADAMRNSNPMYALPGRDSRLPVYACSDDSLRIENTLQAQGKTPIACDILPGRILNPAGNDSPRCTPERYGQRTSLPSSSSRGTLPSS
jgi:hypothetical protein